MKNLKCFLLIIGSCIVTFIGFSIYGIILATKKNGLINTLKMIEKNSEGIFTLNTYSCPDETEDMENKQKLKMGFCKD